MLNTVYLILFLPLPAHAGTIINRPLAIGLNQGLVGHWTFDQKDMKSNNLAYDVSGQGNTGTLTNGPVRAIGRIGQALNFDGVDDRVGVGSGASLDNLSASTICAWIYPRGFGGNNAGRIYSKGPGDQEYMFLIENDGTTPDQTLRFSDGYATTNLARSGVASLVSLNTWQHACATWDGGTSSSGIKLYRNSVESSSYGQSASASGSAISDASSNGDIGGRTSGSTRNFNGLIDDVRVYNRALSADEIKRLYNLGGTFTVNKSQSTGTLKDGLVGHWTFDGKDANGRVDDVSGQGNHGTINWATTTPFVIGKIGQAMEFDGSDDYVSVGDTSVLDLGQGSGKEIAISLWYYERRTSTDFQALIQKSNSQNSTNIDYSLSTVDNSLIWGTGISSDACSWFSTSKPSINTWHHVVGTLVSNGDQTGNKRLYIDGLQVGNCSYAAKAATNNDPLAIGSISSAWFSNSLIDDVRIYNRALSADEIKRLYNMGR